MNNHITARAAAFNVLQSLGSDGAAPPPDIQWMPPGRQKFTLQDHPGKEFELEVTAVVAAKADQMLQEMRAHAATGAGSLPYADKNHEDSEATFEPVRFYWAGEDPKAGGVRVETRWTGFGEQLVKARAFRYFSPSFVFDAARKTFIGIARNIGGLVNDPGFSTIQAFARAGALSPKPQPQNKMTTEEMQQFTELKNSVTKLTETVTTIVQAQARAAATAPATDPTIAELKAKIAKLEAHDEARATESKEATVAHAKACVAKAINRGQLAPQDEASKTFWEGVIVANAKAADELEKLPVNPVFQQIVQASARSGASAATGTDAEKFVALVHAKAGQGKKPGETELNADIAEKPELYQAWRAANGKPGL